MSWEGATSLRRQLEGVSEGQLPSLKPGWLIAEHPPCTIPARSPGKPPSRPGSMVLLLPLTSHPLHRVCPAGTGLFPSTSHKDFSPAGCPGIRGNRFKMTVRIRGSSPPQIGNGLELECRGAGKDYGISWIRQDKDGTLHFIVFISSLSKPTFHSSLGSERTRFDVRNYGAIYQLVVKTFKREDEGNYFCVLINNQMLHFSSGQPVFLPGQQPLHLTPLTSARSLPPHPFSISCLPHNPVSLLVCPEHLMSNSPLLPPEAPCLPLVASRGIAPARRQRRRISSPPLLCPIHGSEGARLKQSPRPPSSPHTGP